MAENQDDQEKTESPSEHRIDEFRKRGDVAVSKELTSVLVLATSLFVLSVSFSFILDSLANYVQWLYSLDITSFYTKEAMKEILNKTFWLGLKTSGPVLFSVAIVVFVSIIGQIGFLFSPEVLTLKLERVNPIEGVKKLFKLRSVIEAFKGLLKFIFILSIVYYFLKDRLLIFNGFYSIEYMQSIMYGKNILAELGFYVILGMLVIALFDYGYQKYSYQKKLMMTKQEAKKEMKEQDGNPEVKQKIKLIQREMSQKRMMDDIKAADVIVTNPTHISIALKYDESNMISPLVVGKGVDHLAFKIREIAESNGIPIVENVPLARSLHKNVKINESVPRNLYKAIAEVLAFVYKLKRRNKALAS